MSDIKTVISFATSILLASPVFAAPQSPTHRVVLDGSRYSTEVEIPQTRQVIFYAVTKGTQSEPLSVTLTAPRGAKLTASMAGLRGNALQQVTNGRGFAPISLKTMRQISQSRTCLEFAPGESSTDIPPIERPESNSPLCDLFSEAEFSALTETLEAVYGGQWSRAQVCGYLVTYYFGGAEDCDPNDPECAILMAPAYSSPVIPAETSTLYGLVHKNACAAKSTKYLVRIKVDLSKVESPTPATVSLALTASLHKFSGSKAATIKPKSDGRFAPEPILLMNYLGTMCGQKLSLVKWRGNQLRRVLPLRLGDLIFYKNWILTRSPIGSVLTGGKGTFELYTTHAGYGVCFDLVRRRQKANGY